MRSVVLLRTRGEIRRCPGHTSYSSNQDINYFTSFVTKENQHFFGPMFESSKTSDLKPIADSYRMKKNMVYVDPAHHYLAPALFKLHLFPLASSRVLLSERVATNVSLVT